MPFQAAAADAADAAAAAAAAPPPPPPDDAGLVQLDDAPVSNILHHLRYGFHYICAPPDLSCADEHISLTFSPLDVSSAVRL